MTLAGCRTRFPRLAILVAASPMIGDSRNSALFFTTNPDTAKSAKCPTGVKPWRRGKAAEAAGAPSNQQLLYRTEDKFGGQRSDDRIIVGAFRRLERSS